jgi:hypothetical protein
MIENALLTRLVNSHKVEAMQIGNFFYYYYFYSLHPGTLVL